MKLTKLLVALMPTLAVASNAAAQVSTTTVVTPVTTKTHTNIVFVTASAGPTVSTCLASVCGFNNASATERSTISLTSFTTSTTTTVIIPPDSTTTIDHATDKSLSTSCGMRTPSTITVTVTETSTPETPIPVITKTVYPIPASSETNVFATNTPSYPSKSLTSTSGAHPSPPYMNGTNINTMTNCTAGSTGYMPLHTNVLVVLPDDPASLSAMLAAMSSEYPVNTIHGSITSTEGVWSTSSSSTLRPLQLFTIIARFISFVNGAVATTKIPHTSVHHIESRFYPYPAPLNSGPPPHLTNTRREAVPNTTTEVNTTSEIRILGTMTTTSTVTLTVTDVPTSTSTYSTPAPPFTFEFPDLSSHSSSQTSNASLLKPITSTTTGSNTTIVAPTSVLPVQNVTVQVPVSSISVVSTTLTAYTTMTSNVTKTVEKQTTHTATVTKTANSFTEGGALPTAASTVEELDIGLCYIIIATWLALVVVA